MANYFTFFIFSLNITLAKNTLICDILIAITVYDTVNCCTSTVLCYILPDGIEIMVCNRHIKSKMSLLFIINSRRFNQPRKDQNVLLQLFCLFLSIPPILKGIIKHTVS